MISIKPWFLQEEQVVVRIIKDKRKDCVCTGFSSCTVQGENHASRLSGVPFMIISAPSWSWKLQGRAGPWCRNQ